MKIEIEQSTLDLVWDCLNEAVMNSQPGPWKTHARRVLKKFEKQYEKSGLKLPVSSNGNATGGETK